MSFWVWGVAFVSICLIIWWVTSGDDEFTLFEHHGLAPGTKHTYITCDGMPRSDCLAHVMSACRDQSGGCSGFIFTRAKGHPHGQAGALTEKVITADDLVPQDNMDTYVPN